MAEEGTQMEAGTGKKKRRWRKDGDQYRQPSMPRPSTFKTMGTA